MEQFIPVEQITRAQSTFSIRLRVQQIAEKTLGDNRPGFKVIEGDYSYFSMNRPAEGDFQNMGTESLHYLHGFESDLASQIDMYLEDESRTNSDQPLIIMDIGGLIGLSWVKLAAYYEQKIRAGKIIFVVANLEYIPNIHDSLFFSKLADEVKDFLNKYQQLVQYIHFRGGKIKLPNGSYIDPYQHVTIIHEHFAAIFWSNIPEHDIFKIALMLTNDGIYFADYLRFREELMSRYPNPHEILDEIERRLKFQKVDVIESGELQGKTSRYLIYRGPKSRPIHLDRKQERKI